MSLRAILALACFLLAAAPSILASGNAPVVTTDQASYFYLDAAKGLEKVEMTFSNPTSSTVWLPYSNPWIITKNGVPVASEVSLLVTSPVPPGGSESASWDFLTNCDIRTGEPSCIGLALPGTYVVSWAYYSPPNGPLQKATTTFEIALPGV